MMEQIPDTIYVDGKPHRVLQGGLLLARDGVVRDAGGREIRESCVDSARASAWLDSGIATDQAPEAPKKRKAAAKKKAAKKKATTKKGGA